jgi:hypothetical protein
MLARTGADLFWEFMRDPPWVEPPLDGGTCPMGYQRSSDAPAT